MPSLNRVEIIGRLGKDPEVRSTPKGTQYSVFSVAVDRRWKSKNGDARQETDWFNVEAWGKTGEICQKYLGKGRLVYVEGALRTTRYDHEGETRYFTKVVVQRMLMLDSAKEEPAVLEIAETPETEED